jgi:glycine cleavage system regulatory protein
MQVNLVLTVIGPDRPGLVSAVSDAIAEKGGNWLDTRMASLSGQFAGMVLVDIAAEKADALEASLHALESHGLRIVVAKTGGEPPMVGRTVRLETIGLDRPGIIRDISHVLAEAHVSIIELESELTSGAFSGEAMFKARALLLLPEGLSLVNLCQALENIAGELMVDLTLDSAAEAVHV